jgi:SAM-dependent methyltransferase
VHINHQYLLDLAFKLHQEVPGLRFLDYGCGKGELAEAGRRMGLDAHGADIFYAANPESREDLRAKGALGNYIHEIIDQRTPFENNSFDVVVSNMVFEHVEDLEAVSTEIHRILRPGGYLIAGFPTLECWREGHIGIPFAHWFGKGSKARHAYVLSLRTLGLGMFKTTPPQEWVQERLNYLDTYTHYRSRRKIREIISGKFSVQWMEGHYAVFRLGRSRARSLSPFFSVNPTRWLGIQLFRRLGFSLLVAQKAGDGIPVEKLPWNGWSTNW